MKNTISVSVILFLCTAVSAQNNTSIPPKADTLYNKLMAAANPLKKNWIQKTAFKYRGKEITELKAMNEVTGASPVLGKMNEGDIEALAFLVLMQASKNAEEDVRNIMTGVKNMNSAKAKQREQIQSVKKDNQPLRTVPTNNIQSLKKDTVKPMIKLSPLVLKETAKKDNLNEMSEEQQLKMQLYMDRKQKASEAISNLLKKIADTEQQIIQNIK